MSENISRKEWDALTEDEKYQYVQLLENESVARGDLLKLIPECPDHGVICLPHCEAWLKRHIQNERIGLN